MMKNKKFLIGISILATTLFLVFVSATISTISPLDGTNHSSATLVLFNVTFVNNTDLLIFGTSQTQVNASFYRVNGTQRTLITNSSQCAITSGTVACWTRFNVSAVDGFFNITSTIFNTTANRNSSVNISSVYFDSTKPLSFAENFTTTQTGGNYSQLTILNISVIDETIGIQSVIFNITNASSGLQNATVTATREGSTSSYSISINSSHYPDGYYNITAYVNDSLGNLNDSARIGQLIFDNTLPSITHSCDDYSVEEDDVITCTCSASDQLSGINTSYGASGVSFTASPSTSNTGNNKQTTCTSQDKSGNLNTSTLYYNVTSISGGSSGGSSGGGSSSTSSSSNSASTNSTSNSTTNNTSSGNANQLEGNQNQGSGSNIKINYWILAGVILVAGLGIAIFVLIKKGILQRLIKFNR